MIYFDHNATTPLDERVLEAMMPFLTTFYANPSALYRAGRIARSAIEAAREQVAALVDTTAAQVIFTSGGTESNNLALQVPAIKSRVAISATEHPCMTEPVMRLKHRGCAVETFDVDTRGLIEQASFEQVSRLPLDFASIMLANNETGVIQDVAVYADTLRSHNVIVHSDAVQALGKIPVSFSKLKVHLLSLSAHKIYGPKGCGALIVEKGLNLEPMQLGGGQEKGIRPGTENVAAIVGFGAAAEIAKAELDQRHDHLLKLRHRLESGLKTVSGAVIFGHPDLRLPNTVQFGLYGVDGEMLQMQLDTKGIAISSGSACASGGGKPSPVLTAMKIAPELAKSAIRVSLGKDNTEAEVDEFLNRLTRFLL
ncbi:cysteine desulfurase [Methylicorpusculum oleiharenae]|uniref:cysteine desulfurase family protein n=1 Tax=Methylicorpusculum oleiharenae TaxID=1338687 RepID=UPI00135CD09B|nr:cysteine desulfurase family protein [Methylicorpusculum oleiharenae]MCD2450630.1 cysteine desulfurase [Methylicorpusculum oleiharenae]